MSLGHWRGVTLHQLGLVDISNSPLQLLRVLREELELGAVALWVFPRVIVSDFSWKMLTNTDTKDGLTSMFECDFSFKPLIEVIKNTVNAKILIQV